MQEGITVFAVIMLFFVLPIIWFLAALEELKRAEKEKEVNVEEPPTIPSKAHPSRKDGARKSLRGISILGGPGLP